MSIGVSKIYVDTAANAIAVLRVGWVAQFGEDANVTGS
jgi:hypothetical protein